MRQPFGQLKVTVVQGKRLVIRDFKSSDPYVVLKLGNQIAKTKVINSCLNPVWNEEHSLSLTEPVGVLSLEVFDKDRFKADDKMGKAHLNLQPIISAARLRHLVHVSSGETPLRKIIPDSENCLARESSIICINGEVVQNVWLRLCEVESGEIELKIKIVDAPSRNGASTLPFALSVCSCCYAMSLRFRAKEAKANDDDEKNQKKQRMVVDLGNGSEVIYFPRIIKMEDSWKFFDYLNNRIPWNRPTIRVFGRSCLQPRDTCYVASEGVTQLIYSGYRPHPYSWDDFPPLKDILDIVLKVLPGSRFNSLLLNRYKGGNDYVGWHADDEKLYGSTPEIASVSFGCERDFLLKIKPSKSSQDRRTDDEPVSKRLKKKGNLDQHSFTLKHGSMLVMRGHTQRDWIHSVPRRAKAESTRINLTFRHVLQ